MGMPEQYIMPQIQEVTKPDIAHQIIDWIGNTVWGGWNTVLISALIGLPIALMFIFRARVAFILAPLAELILKLNQRGKK